MRLRLRIGLGSVGERALIMWTNWLADCLRLLPPIQCSMCNEWSRRAHFQLICKTVCHLWESSKFVFDRLDVEEVSSRFVVE